LLPTSTLVRIWTLNIRDAARHYDVLPPDEDKGLMLSILGGAVMDLEERLLAAEQRLATFGSDDPEASK
jgi:hypothetical protein